MSGFGKPMKISVLAAAVALLSSSLAVLTHGAAPGANAQPARLPNFVIILADDLGYADLGAFGAKAPATPHTDRLAREGIRLTSFYVAQPVCSASRAALLTGSYSNRVGISGALNPGSRIGLNADEQTLPEILKARGYATGIFGKWHLGDAPQFLPTRHGFDEYVGIPYSNDMWPPRSPTYPPLPLMEGERTVKAIAPEDQAQLTRLLTGRAVEFIERHREQPFLLYLAHPMPHVPLFVSEAFRGSSGRGLYGDVIAELDWSVGQVLDALAARGLDANTLVIFASDNGPWIQYGDHAGSAAPLRAGKHTTFEGGVRVPFIARWPGHLPAGRVIDTPMMTIDVLPTLAALAGTSPPADRIIDGRDVWPWLAGPPPSSDPHDALYFYNGTELHAVRSGRWKLHVPHSYVQAEPGQGGAPGRYVKQTLDLSLYDLTSDPGESTNVAAAHPDVVEALMKYVERARDDLGDSLVSRPGKNARPPADNRGPVRAPGTLHGARCTVHAHPALRPASCPPQTASRDGPWRDGRRGARHSA